MECWHPTLHYSIAPPPESEGKMIRRLVVFFTLFWVAGTLAQAPSYTISGTVTDGAAPLQGVTVVASDATPVTRSLAAEQSGTLVEAVFTMPSGLVSGVHVALRASHCDMEDVSARLTHPDGTSATLFNTGRFSSSIDTVFPDATASQDPLDVFCFKPTAGNWRVSIESESCPDVTVHALSLTVDLFPGAVTGADGTYAIDFVSAGTWSISAWLPGTAFTPVAREVTLSAVSPTATGVDFAAAGTPALEVTSPNGGETVCVGTSLPITWTTNVCGHVKIDVERDGNWETIIPQTPNDGEETWTVTGPTTADARARVTLLEDAGFSDTSDGPFSVVRGSLGGTVTSAGNPAAGITVSAAGAGPLTFSSTDARTGRRLVTSFTVPASGTVQGVHVALRAYHCDRERVGARLRHPDGTQVGLLTPGQFDGDGTIDTVFPDETPPLDPLTRLAGKPAEGVWSVEVWSTTGCRYVTLNQVSLTVDASAAAYSATTGPDGTYVIPNLDAGTFAVSAWSAGRSYTPAIRSVTLDNADPSPRDVDFAEAAGAGALTVTSPNGGETTRVGDALPITWTTNVGGRVKIEISRDGEWETIVPSAPNDGSETWRVTRPATGSARVRVTVLDDPSIQDASDGDFAIGTYTISGTVRGGGAGMAGVVVQASGEGSLSFTSSPNAEFPGSAEGYVPCVAEFPINVTGMGPLTAVRVGLGFSHCDAWSMSAYLVHPDGTTVTLFDHDTFEDDRDGVDIDTVIPDYLAPAQSLSVLNGKPGSGTWKLRILNPFCPSGLMRFWSLHLEGALEAASATTGADGAFTIEDLAAGTYSVSPSADGFVSNPLARDVTVGPDQSGVDFDTESAALTVTYPNGGEVAYMGEGQTITWTTNVTGGSVKIEVSRDSGATWETLTNSTANDGTEPWTTNGPATEHARVRVTSCEQPSASDTSDTDFILAGYSISGTVTEAGAGVAGATVRAGGPVEVTTSFDPDAFIPPKEDDGDEATQVTIPIQVTGGGRITGVHIGFTLSHCNADELAVLLYHHDGTRAVVADWGDLDEDEPDYLYPDDDDPHDALDRFNGKPAAGTWLLRIKNFSCPPGYVRSVTLRLETAAEVETTTGADGTYTLDGLAAGAWAVSAEKAGYVLTPAVHNVALGPSRSDVDFTVPGHITVTAPNGGEVLGVGTTTNLTWESAGVTGNVNVDLSRDGGDNWEPLFADTANDGTEPWPVAGAPTDHALLRVRAADLAGLQDVSDAEFAITAPAKLAFTVQPCQTKAGCAMAPGVQVTVQCATGRPITSACHGITLAIAANPSAGTLAGTFTVDAVNGVATFPDLCIDKAGKGYTLSAAAAGLTDATSAAFDVVGAPAALAFTVQPPRCVAAGIPMAPAVQVSVLDEAGSLVADSALPITLVIGTNPRAALLTGTTTVNAVNGVATFADLQMDKASGLTYTLAASSGALTAVSTPFYVQAGAPAKLAFTVQPRNACAGAPIAPAVKVAIVDACGNTIPRATNPVTIAIGTNPKAGTLSGAATANAVGGTATFADLSLDKASGAAYTLVASSPGLEPATSRGFFISAGAPARLVFSVQPRASVGAGAVIAPAVRVTIQDACGNTASRATDTVTVALAGGTPGAALSGTLSVAAVGGSASFSNLQVDTPGVEYTLAASSGTLAGATSTPFRVNAPAIRGTGR